MSQSHEEKLDVTESTERKTLPPATDAPTAGTTDDSMSDNEKSLLHKIAEVGEDTVKRLKEVFSEVDRDELRKSVNRDQIQRSIASTLDTLNAKAQSFLAPKNDDDASEAKSDPLHSEITLETSPDAPGPVGNEAVHSDEAPRHPAVAPPENETRSFT